MTSRDARAEDKKGTTQGKVVACTVGCTEKMKQMSVQWWWQEQRWEMVRKEPVLMFYYNIWHDLDVVTALLARKSHCSTGSDCGEAEQ